MDVFQAIVLGIVQGLTEFLPISSTGHLRIVPAFAGWEDPGAAFTAIIQLGTMAAVLLYFRTDLFNVARTWLASLRDPSKRSDPDAKLGWCLIVGTVPIAIFGFAFQDSIENDARNLWIIGTTLIVLGLVLLAAEKSGRRERKVDSVSIRDGWIVGLAQAAALVPGVSRSGATISAGLFLGFDREAAARFSFLLSVPAVLLSGLFEFKGVLDGSVEGEVETVPLIVATALSFVVGYISIAGLLRFLASNSTFVFVAYRVVLGIVVLALVGAGTLDAQP